MRAKPKSYEEAYRELQSLAEKLESDEVGIDQLSDVVERAKILVQFCQERLRTTEASLKSPDSSL